MGETASYLSLGISIFVLLQITRKKLEIMNNNLNSIFFIMINKYKEI